MPRSATVPAMPDMIDARDATLTRLLDDAAMLPPMELGPVEALRAHLRLADEMKS